MSPAPSPDVILVGGGVISCATAYFLAKEGLRPLIVEREAVGYGASGAAAGLLSPLADLRGEGPTTELGLVSLRLHRELAQSLPAESGIDYHFSDIPVLRPAFNDDEEGELREAVRCQQALGLDVSWADQNGLLQIDEGLTPEAQGALHSRVEAQVEPYRFVLALTAAVERMGGAVRYAWECHRREGPAQAPPARAGPPPASELADTQPTAEAREAILGDALDARPGRRRHHGAHRVPASLDHASGGGAVVILGRGRAWRPAWTLVRGHTDLLRIRWGQRRRARAGFSVRRASLTSSSLAGALVSSPGQRGGLRGGASAGLRT